MNLVTPTVDVGAVEEEIRDRRATGGMCVPQQWGGGPIDSAHNLTPESGNSARKLVLKYLLRDALWLCSCEYCVVS